MKKTQHYLYKNLKTGIKKEEWIENSEESQFMLKAPTNTLQSNWRNSFKGESIECKVCGHENEKLDNFLL